ncbi:transcriptional activator RfaH [Novosphingobium sp. SL115]|uniref:transcription termination/antitermination protein NusG n=1 Tax=Novosphingobium sp. SL115 TaxID=2995150 RepID=UPI002276DFE0|nr:transcriptional activator RfaH [Novosphingobium sp. SL115]MCY1669492.1 transcriptional activator RfaH [Novosphingobium sp. SL115]
MEQGDTAHARAGDRWFVVQTHPRKEAFAAIQLARQKFTSFWPRFRKTVRHARKSREVLAPLFPGYLFVRFDPLTAPWRWVNSTFGVRGLVGGRDHMPLSVPEAVMEHILSRCDNGIVRSTLADFRPGQTVKVLAGPFAERLARIVECDELGRVALLLELLGQDHVVSMQSTSVGLA